VAEPFVSIVTPVYNGAKFLRQCIEGVLNQRYPHFEYVILDNASTDGTADIIAEYAAKDTRIRHFRNPKTLKIIDNWNESRKYISDEAAWVKFAFADDILFPNCVAEMVAAGEQDPQIGFVSAYHLDGRIVANVGLPMHQTVADGREMLKQQLLRRMHVCLDSPNTVLYRRSVLDRLNGIDRNYFHADTELALRILNTCQLGFVHQVLTWTGVHEGRGASFAFYHGLITQEYLDFAYKNISRYGDLALTAEEKTEMARYYAFEVLNYFAKHLVYFLWSDFRRLWQQMPGAVKREVLPCLRRKWAVLTRRLLGSVVHYRTRKRPSFEK
jgi:glycosyltransferase involved in cell wall biosynthesis